MKHTRFNLVQARPIRHAQLRISARLWLLVLAALALLAACSERPTPAPPPATPTLIATLEAYPSPIAVTSVVDRELLGAEMVKAVCDAPPEATFSCTGDATTPQIELQIDPSTYGRWSTHWQDAAPLSGDETIALQLTSSGNLAPNIYLVTQDGERLGIPLAPYGLEEGAQNLHIPLREVRDNQGNTLDASKVNGLELVFEWAAMQGTLALESLRIESVWREPAGVGEEAQLLAASLQAPAGFVIEARADNLPQMTQVDFTTDGEMLVSQQDGRVWLYRDTDGKADSEADSDDAEDGAYRYDERILYTVASPDLVGLLYDPADGGVWLGSHGQLVHTLDTDGDGVADQHTTRFEGVQWGRHQNNGMAWNPDPDPFTGEAGGTWIYFGFGSVDDLEAGGPLNATILRFPRTGEGVEELQVVSTGNRNAYDVVWAALPTDPNQPEGKHSWQLFASENGPDFNDAPDEVNHIRRGNHYGFPDQFGPVAESEIEGEPYSSPVYAVTPHASADGIAFIDNPTWPAAYRTLYVSLFGEVFSPTPVGHFIERITLEPTQTPDGEITYRGQPSPFITGFDRPLPLVTMPNGNLLVGDYATGVIYEISYQGE